MNRRREDTSGANTFNQVQTRICISKPFYAVTERALRCTFDNSVSRKCSEIPSGRGGPSNRVTVERCVFFHSLIFSEKKENLLPTYHCQTEQFTEKRSEQETIRNSERGCRDTIPLLRILLASFLYGPLLYAETIENAFTSSRNLS